MTLKTTMINGIFNGKALAATALLLPMLALPFNARADGPPTGVDPAPIEQSTSAEAETASPSYFEPDADGVLWFQKGTDSRGPFAMALGRADEADGIIIFIATSETAKGKAVERAKQLKNWLEAHPGGPGKGNVEIAVAVLGNGSGTLYYYYVDTMRYWNSDMGENEAEGRFTAQAAATALPDVIITYQAAKKLRNGERSAEQATAQPLPEHTVASTTPGL